MILFAADNHYDAYPGRVLYETVKDDYPIEFFEDDWSCFEQDLTARYDLMILNMIADTCKVPAPSPEAQSCARKYVESGKPILLLHGGSAAFWPCDWWRSIVGLRWVRGNDPDGFEKSCHPKRPYKIEVNKCRHPLCNQLQPAELPEDEIYIDLEQTAPITILMETTTEEGTFPMSYVTETLYNGTIACYLPGHDPEVVRHPTNVANCRTLIDWLLA